MKVFLTKYWKILLAMAGIFLAGMLVGGALTVGVIVTKVRDKMNPATWKERALSRLESQLQLTAEQKKEVDPIIGNAVDRLKQMRREAILEFASIIREANDEVEVHLTPEQKKKLEKFIQEREKRWHQMCVDSPDFKISKE